MTAMSYANGPAGEALLGQTIGENLAATVARFPDRDALIDAPSGRRWTTSMPRECRNPSTRTRTSPCPSAT